MCRQLKAPAHKTKIQLLELEIISWIPADRTKQLKQFINNNKTIIIKIVEFGKDLQLNS